MKKAVFSFISLLGGMVLLSGCGWQSKDASDISEPLKSNSADTISNSPLDEQNPDVSSIRTYTNKEYGFAFDYRADWKLEQHTPENSEAVNISLQRSETSRKNEEFGSAGTEFLLPEVTILYYENIMDEPNIRSNNYSSLEEMLTRSEAFGKVQQRVIEGRRTWSVVEYAMTDIYIIFIENNGGVYEILFSHPEIQEEFMRNFHILQSGVE